jgi:hypothetical protein
MANGSASSCHSTMANSQVRTERSPVAHKGDAISVDLSPHPTGPTPIASAPELPLWRRGEVGGLRRTHGRGSAGPASS